MREVLKTNNPVLLNYAQVVLADAGIDAVVFDTHMSVVDGSLGILPRRVMVAGAQHARAEAILKDALADASNNRKAGDGFLGGRITVVQPETGFRSGLDAVMLAAAVPARAGDTALELGAGAGAASLCLAARVEDCVVTGVEIDAGLVEIATSNAFANALPVTFVQGDVFALPGELRRDFTHVFCNPPFHGANGDTSADEARARALADGGALANWLAAGLRRTVSNGTFTAILRADRLPEALAALPGHGVTLFPLWPRAGEPAKRMIVQVAKDSRRPLVTHHGLVLHESEGRFTDAAEDVLRDGAALELG